MNECAKLIHVAGLGLAALAWFNLFFGLFTAFSPDRSIRLYAWIMEKYNWRVSPIDPKRELRNTRILGMVLASLSLVYLFKRFQATH